MHTLYLLILIMSISLHASHQDPCNRAPLPSSSKTDHYLQALEAAQQLKCNEVVDFIKQGVKIDSQVHHQVAYCAIVKQEWPLLANALKHPDSASWWNLAHQPQCSAECIKLLAKHKVNLNHPGIIGNTPLHNAVARRDMQTTQALIRSGANVHAKNTFCQTPAHLITEQMGEDLPTAVGLLLTLQKATLWSIMHTKDQMGNTPAEIINRLEYEVCSEPNEYAQKHCIKLISSLQELKEYYQNILVQGVLCGI